MACVSSMYTIHRIHDGVRTTEERITRDVAHVWIEAESPTDAELDELRVIMPISDEITRDTQDVNEVPKLEIVDGVLYVLLQTPAKNSGKNKTVPSAHYDVSPLGILVKNDIIITIVWRPNDVVVYLKEKLSAIAQNHIVDTTKPEQMLIKWFLFSAKVYLRYLKEIHARLKVPSTTRHQHFEKDIVDLLNTEESLVYFNASLRSNGIVLDKLAKRRQIVGSEESKESLEDAQDEMLQALEVTKVYSHIVEDLRGAVSSLISNNLTRTVNWLTELTVIIMIPTLVASVYGMNVTLPFANRPLAFWAVMGIAVVLAVVAMLWLRRRKLN